MKVMVRILHLPSDMQSWLYEAMGTLFASEENKNNDFIQQFLCQQSPLCLSISLYAEYALLYHPRHKDALFSFNSKLNTVETVPCGADDTEEHTQHTVIWRDTEKTVDKGIVE